MFQTLRALFFCSWVLVLAGRGLSAQGDYQKGVSYYKQGEYAKAIVEFEPIVQENPEYEAGFRVLGDCYLKLKQFSKATAAFQKAIELNDGEFFSHYGLAISQFNLGQFRSTIAALLRGERTAKSASDRYRLLHTRGTAYFNIEDFSKAVADLEKAVAIRRGGYDDLLQLGIAHFQLGNKANAKSYLTQARALQPDSADARRYLSRIQYEESVAAIKSGHFKIAAGFLEGYVQENPQDGEAWFNLGLARLFAEDLNAAEEAFLKSAEVAPGNWRTHQRLGFIYEKNKAYAKSLAEYEKALKLNDSKELAESVERLKERLRRAQSG